MLGKATEMTPLVLPSEVTAIGGDAFGDFTILRSVMHPAECVRTEGGMRRAAFAVCRCPVAAAIQKGCSCKAITLSAGAVSGQYDDPDGSTMNEDRSSRLRECTALPAVVFPRGCASSGQPVEDDCPRPRGPGSLAGLQAFGQPVAAVHERLDSGPRSTHASAVERGA